MHINQQIIDLKPVLKYKNSLTTATRTAIPGQEFSHLQPLCICRHPSKTFQKAARFRNKTGVAQLTLRHSA